jgi:hypothetical protein
MVGLQNDKVNLTPLEQAIKGKSEIDRELLSFWYYVNINNKTEVVFTSIE